MSEENYWLSERLQRRWLIKISVNLYLAHSSSSHRCGVCNCLERIRSNYRASWISHARHSMKFRSEWRNFRDCSNEVKRNSNNSHSHERKNWDNLIDCFRCLIYLLKPAQTMGNELPACISWWLHFLLMFISWKEKKTVLTCLLATSSLHLGWFE